MKRNYWIDLSTDWALGISVGVLLSATIHLRSYWLGASLIFVIVVCVLNILCTMNKTESKNDTNKK